MAYGHVCEREHGLSNNTPDTFPCETHAGFFFFLIHHGEFQTASKNPYVVMASVAIKPSQGGRYLIGQPRYLTTKNKWFNGRGASVTWLSSHLLPAHEAVS